MAAMKTDKLVHSKVASKFIVCPCQKMPNSLTQSMECSKVLLVLSKSVKLTGN